MVAYEYWEELSYFKKIFGILCSCVFAAEHAENYKDEYINEISNMNAFLKKTEDYSAGTHSLAETAIVWSGKTANFYQSSALKTDFTEVKSSQEEKYKSDMAADFEGWYDILSRLHVFTSYLIGLEVHGSNIRLYFKIIQIGIGSDVDKFSRTQVAGDFTSRKGIAS